MVPEIYGTTDRIFCHFGSLFALYPPPPDNLKNQNFEKLKKKQNKKKQRYYQFRHMHHK